MNCQPRREPTRSDWGLRRSAHSGPDHMVRLLSDCLQSVAKITRTMSSRRCGLVMFLSTIDLWPTTQLIRHFRSNEHPGLRLVADQTANRRTDPCIPLADELPSTADSD